MTKKNSTKASKSPAKVNVAGLFSTLSRNVHKEKVTFAKNFVKGVLKPFLKSVGLVLTNDYRHDGLVLWTKDKELCVFLSAGASNDVVFMTREDALEFSLTSRSRQEKAKNIFSQSDLVTLRVILNTLNERIGSVWASDGNQTFHEFCVMTNILKQSEIQSIRESNGTNVFCVQSTRKPCYDMIPTSRKAAVSGREQGEESRDWRDESSDWGKNKASRKRS